MARTRSPDYDKIHDEIIRKAAAIFASRGYAATSIGDIAQACGCSKSRLYHYFDSKEAILLDMLNTHVDTLLERCRHSLYGFQDPHERFQQLIRFFLEVYAVSRDKQVTLLTCLDFLAAENQKELIAKQRQLIAYVRDILLQLRPDMASDLTIAHVDTMMFFGMINWTYTWYKSDGEVPPQELADRAVELFTNGYLKLSKRPAKTPEKSAGAASLKTAVKDPTVV